MKKNILSIAAQPLQRDVPHAMMQTRHCIRPGCGLAVLGTTVYGDVTRDISDLRLICVRLAELHLRVHTTSM